MRRQGLAVCGPKTKKKRYTFDYVFSPDASQSDVFHAVGLPVLHEVLRGYDALYPGIQAITIWAITICAITIRAITIWTIAR